MDSMAVEELGTRDHPETRRDRFQFHRHRARNGGREVASRPVCRRID
jgi:hypothetical protein